MQHLQQTIPMTASMQPSMPPSMYSSDTMLYNMLVTTLIGVIVSSLSTNLSSIVTKVFYYGSVLLSRVFAKYTTDKNNEVIVTSTTILGQGGLIHKCSPHYKAILYKLHKKKINIKKIKENGNSVTTFDRVCDNNDGFDYIINHRDEIIMSMKNDIRISSYSDMSQPTYSMNEKSSAMDVTTYNIRLYSSKLTTTEINNLLNRWTSQYMEHLRQYVETGKIFYYFITDIPNKTPTEGKKRYELNPYEDASFQRFPSTLTMSYSAGIKWSSYELVTFKTFDNIFFTEKQFLINKLNYFLDNELVYKERGIPYNFGLLLHGPPGCGKTSCIKALANMTKRHVMEINLSKIKTCGEFISIFINDFIETTYIPVNKRIIVLEDIDCMMDIVQQRKEELEPAVENAVETADLSSMNTDQLLKMRLLSTFDVKKSKHKAEDKLTLACILNTIDGVLEQYGRILIITTNYPQKLDSALIRPGRIDVKVGFTLCTHTMIKDIIEFFYKKAVPNDVKFVENVFTPAEVINKCANMDNTFDSMVQEFIALQVAQ